MFDELVPVLQAAGSEVFVDRKRFEAGKCVVGQMDSTQDSADLSVLVLSPDYVASSYCLHELERAVARDPTFERGLTVPVVREACDLPRAIKTPNPLLVDLKSGAPTSWALLLRACAGDLGCAAPDWLATRNELVVLMKRGQSVNLVVPRTDSSSSRPRWRELVEHVREAFLPTLALVDLERGVAASRPGLVTAILAAAGHAQAVPPKPADLGVLDRALSGRQAAVQVALLHFDYVARRNSEYESDLFGTLRDLVQRRKLVLLIESRRPFVELLPLDHPLSSLTQLHGVELRPG